MKPWLFGILTLGALATWGCSTTTYESASPSTSPSGSPVENCERAGGVWRATLSYCEYPERIR